MVNDGQRERELQLVGRIVVGRDPSCEISHDDALLSRRHAEFVAERDMITVRDLGSRNGVFVNGARLVEQALEPGDVVQIGPLRARFEIRDASPAVEPGGTSGDRTAVIRSVFAGAGAPASVEFEPDDEDATRLVAAPRMRAALASHVDDSEGPTRFFDPADAASLRRDAGAEPEQDLTPRRGGERLRGFIFGQVAMLAALVLAASVLPAFIWRQPGAAPVPLSWIAIPALAALAGAYIVGTSIAGRVADALGDADRSGR